MKLLKFLTLCAAITTTGVANAEMVELEKSNDGLTTLRGLVGSLKPTAKGASGIFSWAKIPYQGAERSEITNFKASITKATCKAGAGDLVIAALSGSGPQPYEWAAGDGSLGDYIANTLCLSMGITSK